MTWEFFFGMNVLKSIKTIITINRYTIYDYARWIYKSRARIWTAFNYRTACDQRERLFVHILLQYYLPICTTLNNKSISSCLLIIALELKKNHYKPPYVLGDLIIWLQIWNAVFHFLWIFLVGVAVLF